MPSSPFTRFIPALVFVITGALFSSAIDGDFVDYDDWQYIFDARTQRGLSLENLRVAFTETLSANYHPLTWLSHMADMELFGPEPRAHHFVNVLFHAANGALVSILLLRLGAAPLSSFLLACFFALHPLRVESVAWVAERKDILCGFFYLLALILWIDQRRRYSFFFTILALLSKPMAVSLPVAFLLYDILVCRRGKSALLAAVPTGIAAAVLSVVTIIAQHDALQPAGNIPLSLRLETSAVSAVFSYAANTISPGCMHILYPYQESWPTWKVATSLLVFMLLLMAILLGTRKSAGEGNRLASFGLSWAIASFLPVSGIIMVGVAAAADRYTYLPTLGVLVATIPLLNPILVKRPVVFLVLAAIVVRCAVLTHAQIATWRSTETLLAHALMCEPDNAHLLVQSANIDVERGDLVAARTKLQHATRLRPGLTEAWATAGIVATREQAWANAAEYWVEVLSLDPTSSLGHLGLSLALFGLGNTSAGVREFDLAGDFAGGSVRDLNVLLAGFVHLQLPKQIETVHAGHEHAVRRMVHLRESRRPAP
jgi:hypothetical protein